MYRDEDDSPGKRSTYNAIETPQGELRRLIELNGQKLSPQAEQKEVVRIQHFLNDPGEQAKQRRDGEHDDAQAERFTRMLPEAFTWTIVSQQGDATKLHYAPNPAFHAPSMEARVLAAMEGDMVVAHDGNRIQSLRGKLTHDVRFSGGGILRQDECAGGNLSSVDRRPGRPRSPGDRREPRPHRTATQLIFKTISQNSDEIKTGWKPSPDKTPSPKPPPVISAFRHHADRPSCPDSEAIRRLLRLFLHHFASGCLAWQSKRTVMTMTAKWNLLGLAATALLTATSAAQTAGQQNLPSAPSAVLNAEQRAQQDEALGKPAGNGFRLNLATQPIGNGLVMELPKDGPLNLSLDDAISLALERNIRLKYDRANETSVRGLTLSVINVLIPNMTLSAKSNAQEVDLAALGFKGFGVRQVRQHRPHSSRLQHPEHRQGEHHAGQHQHRSGALQLHRRLRALPRHHQRDPRR